MMANQDGVGKIVHQDNAWDVVAIQPGDQVEGAAMMAALGEVLDEKLDVVPPGK